jgi:hypothetical protein
VNSIKNIANVMLNVGTSSKIFHMILSFIKWKLLGGEGKVLELLEDESEENIKKPLLHDSDENNNGTEQRSFCNFFWRPCRLGKDLLAIEKFGLVQYVGAIIFLSKDPLLL